MVAIEAVVLVAGQCCGRVCRRAAVLHFEYVLIIASNVCVEPRPESRSDELRRSSGMTGKKMGSND